MSNRIFTNGEEGKILTSVGNRIIKQPYEFGNAFQNRMGLNNYIEISGIVLPDIWSFATIFKGLGIHVDNGLLQVISTSANLADNIIVRSAPSGKLLVNMIDDLPFSDHFARANRQVLLCYLSSTQSNYKGYNNNDGTLTTVDASRNNAIRDKIRVGTSDYYTVDTATTQSYLSSLSLLNAFYLFDRELSISEILYLHNNNLFNELQSATGLFVWFKMQQAEIINILGVDQPCVRDYSGNNRHGIIMNLPAGTVQQKVDYANANLFVPFI